MFENISKKFQQIFRGVRGAGRLSEKNIADALREVRLALLEADVNFRVAKDLVEKVRADSLGQEVLVSIKPGQLFIKFVHDRLVEVMKCPGADLKLSGSPALVMLVGLQGAGKTTVAAKLARLWAGQGRHPLLVACDVSRPAAERQLEVMGERAGVPVWLGREGDSASKRASDAIEYAPKNGLDLVILDTAGRLHVDESLMSELSELKAAFNPGEVLLVLDAMTGQDAVNVAREFEDRVGITGAVLTKLDGDARGGAAISLGAVTGKPIKLIGTGEGLTDLSSFEPERMASRVLGMGDVVGLVEKASEAFDEEEAARLERKLRRASFDLEDFRGQLQRLDKMGSWDALAGFLPASISEFSGGTERLGRMRAILDSMTRTERGDPTIIDGSRRRRIAAGSGTTVQEVNQLLKQFSATRKMMARAGRLRGNKNKIKPGGVHWPLQ